MGSGGGGGGVDVDFAAEKIFKLRSLLLVDMRFHEASEEWRIAAVFHLPMTVVFFPVITPTYTGKTIESNTCKNQNIKYSIFFYKKTSLIRTGLKTPFKLKNPPCITQHSIRDFIWVFGFVTKRFIRNLPSA